MPTNEVSTDQALLSAHMANLDNHWQQALSKHGYAGAWLSAGNALLNFQDDHGPRFVPNPYLSQWIDPAYLSPGARLLILPGERARLFVHQPKDYWHAAAPLPEQLSPYLDIVAFAQMSELLQACQQAIPEGAKLAHIGPEDAANEVLGELNPTALVNYLHFHRAKKSPYEIQAMRLASEVGARGHLAAAEAFQHGASEYEIHMAYLLASQQSENELPYGNIVALNQHGSILHYQYQERTHTQPPLSLLIDAGGSHRGFASDITRTYAKQGETEFAQLIDAMNSHQLKLIQGARAGRTFADLHVQMHQQLAQVLVEAGIVTCSAESAFDSGLTEAFCPHGLGHLLGLQVHDVGGHLADDQGGSAPPPPNYPTLRFTREIEVDQVFTIEPGLYFIPMLLSEERNKKSPIDWSVVDRLAPYGGIRIEDNIQVGQQTNENLTRSAFERVANEH